MDKASKISKSSNKQAHVLVCLLLIAVTVVAYWQVMGNGFIRYYDDGSYVTDNPHVPSGRSMSVITQTGIR